MKAALIVMSGLFVIMSLVAVSQTLKVDSLNDEITQVKADLSNRTQQRDRAVSDKQTAEMCESMASDGWTVAIDYGNIAVDLYNSGYMLSAQEAALLDEAVNAHDEMIVIYEQTCGAVVTNYQ